MAAMQTRSRRIPASDGLSLHILEWSQEGVPLIMLHGFGNEAHIFDDFAPRMAPHYRTLAIDLRGHGESEHDSAGRYDYDSHVRDLEAVTRALGIERLVLLGHSFGSRVAMLFAAAHPQRMAGLVIVDAGPELDPRGTTRIQMEVAGREAGGKDADGSFASAAEYEQRLVHNYPAATAEAVRRMAQYELRQREDGRFVRRLDPAFHAARAGVSREQAERQERETTRRLWEALAKIPCPCLVVRGAASDVLAADVADRMVDEVLAAGQLAVVAQSGHSVMTDNPEGFAQAVGRFALGE